MTWKSKCDDPHCPGWAVFNENEIQRCDSCDRFASEAEALAHVIDTGEVSRMFNVRCDGIQLVACELKGFAWILSKVLDGVEYPVKLYRVDRNEMPPRDLEALLEDAEYEVPR